MKIMIESTTKIVSLNGIECRIWEGETEHGVKIHCFISRIAAKADQDLTQFEMELQECRPPSVELDSIPLRLII